LPLQKAAGYADEDPDKASTARTEPLKNIEEYIVKRALIRNLSLGAIGGVILGVILLLVGIMNGAKTSTSTDSLGNTTTTVTSVGHPALVAIGVVLLIAASIVGLVAWIGGLIRAAQQRQWVWFICMLFVGGLFTTLLWSLISSDRAAAPPVTYAQPYPQPYPQQQ
jgi:formate/nitrite transporter FocA (FNT family)